MSTNFYFILLVNFKNKTQCNLDTTIFLKMLI